MLAGLLLFSAVGFLIENLFDSRHKLSAPEYLIVWAVFVINVLGGEYIPQYGLLIAIGSGMIWGLVMFAVRFAKASDLGSSRVISGEIHCSTAIRSAAQEMKLGVLGVWYTIFKSGTGVYIFFGTAALLYRRFKAFVAENQCVCRARRACCRCCDAAVTSAATPSTTRLGSIFSSAWRPRTRAPCDPYARACTGSAHAASVRRS